MYLSDRILDYGLYVLVREVTRLVLCKDPPADWESAVIETNCLAQRDLPVVAGPMNATSGRKVTVETFADGEVLAAGTAAHWALIDDGNHRLLASNTTLAPIVLAEHNTFTMPEIAITMPLAEATSAASLGHHLAVT